MGLLNPYQRLPARPGKSLRDGAKYALAVGAAGTVGIVIGLVTLTGVDFKVSYIVISATRSSRAWHPVAIPEAIANTQSLTLVAALS